MHSSRRTWFSLRLWHNSSRQQWKYSVCIRMENDMCLHIADGKSKEHLWDQSKTGRSSCSWRITNWISCMMFKQRTNLRENCHGILHLERPDKQKQLPSSSTTGNCFFPLWPYNFSWPLPPYFSESLSTPCCVFFVCAMHVLLLLNGLSKYLCFCSTFL